MTAVAEKLSLKTAADVEKALCELFNGPNLHIFNMEKFGTLFADGEFRVQ